MPFRISGKNIDIGDALRARVNARIAEAMGKYFDGGYSGHVTVGKEGFGFRTECAVHLDWGSRCRRREWRPMPMPAPTRPPFASRNGCAAIIAGSRTARSRAPTASAPRSRPMSQAPSYVIAAPEPDGEDAGEL